MLSINITTIPHEEQRYPTVGDYNTTKPEACDIRISELKNWKYESLVAVHELIEMLLCRYRNINEQDITDFDIGFEKARGDGLAEGEAGDSPSAPYKKEHYFATNIERLLAAELGVDWGAYEKAIDSL